MSHDHARAPLEYEAFERALRELLVERGLFVEAEIAERVDLIVSRTPALGARVVARAWFDPGYKERLLQDGNAAAAELGIDIGATRLVVVENTPDVHNLIVCTLCSCYPRLLLGLPPDWYKSPQYRARAVREPRAVLAEFGTRVGAGVAVRVHDSTADMRYLVLPMRPSGADRLGEEACAALVTRDAMIGVAPAAVPAP
jgi:nitrile hydratase subunit alpha